MSQVPFLTFTNGYKMPTLGLGTYQSKQGEVDQAVMDAIDLGYRHIDTAYFYENEEEVGKAIKAKIDDGTVKREDLFITTKLWNNSHKEESVATACKRSLKNLGLSYLDLYLVHWPLAFEEGESLMPMNENGNLKMTDTDYIETWRGMENCVRQGLTRSIGVSNFNSEQIVRLVKEAVIKPENNQIEVNVNVNQSKLINLCKNHNITVTGYSPLGQPGTKTVVNFCHPEIQKISKKYNKTPAQVVLRYVLDLGIAAIPKSVTKNRMRENMEVFDFVLTPDEINRLESIGTGERSSTFRGGKGHKYWPFAIPY